MKREPNKLKRPVGKPRGKVDRRRKEFQTKEMLEMRRRNAAKAREARRLKKKVKPKKKNVTTIDIPPVIVKRNNGFHMALSMDDFASIKEVLHNCALAGLSLTRCGSSVQTLESIKKVGSAIGEVCLEGIQVLKNAEIYKKP